MPFDSAPQQADDLLTFTPGREGLRKLATLLRMQMPGFTWDFRVVGSRDDECGTSGCAIGLARALWPEARKLMPGRSDTWSSEVARAFKMSIDDADGIFFTPMTYGKRWGQVSLVTATEVADAIDAFLARTS